MAEIRFRSAAASIAVLRTASANAPIAGLKIQVRVGKAAWRTYEGPIAITGPVLLRTLSPDGRRVSRMVSVN